MSLIAALQNPALYDHPVNTFEVIETHISWVLLTGPYAYKIKKPVNFGFLDFSTLAKRKHFCEEEIRLNRRLAPQLYLEVISINGSPDAPRLGGNGPAIEYAVKMHQFPQSAQLDRHLAREGLTTELIERLAHIVANFHAQIDVVPAQSHYGDIEHIRQPVLENFAQIRDCIHRQESTLLLDQIEHWTHEQLLALHDTFRERKQKGFIRECHGDMHLRNMALLDDIVIFDCIEFNKNLYLIDVMSEIAFVVMDLEDRNQTILARQFLNIYLQISGDYQGLRVLDFYKVYRAMVRAKVNALRIGQEREGSQEYQQTLADFMQYLHLAETYIHPRQPLLLINHGVSGSGKSFFTRQLLDAIPAIVLRSDVERKRLFKRAPEEHATEAVDAGIYSPQAGVKTYAHLAYLAKVLLEAGYIVIIDAANLKQAQREIFTQLANDLDLPYIILYYQASEQILRQRVSDRLLIEHDASDATIQVLEKQLKTMDSLSPEELLHTIDLNSEQNLKPEAVLEQIQRKLNNQTLGNHSSFVVSTE